MSAAEKIRILVGADDVGLRIDQFLAARIPGLSRRKARVLLDIGGVYVDRTRVKVASRKVRVGQKVEVVMGGALERATPKIGREARAKDAAALPEFAILHEDDELVVVDKPAGLLTAPTPESDRGNLADSLGRRPGGAPVFVVHRLDLETSGVLVLAKSELANRALSDAFRAHRIERRYLAVVEGAWPDGELRIESPVAGKAAISHFEVLERFDVGATLLEARLETGRTHQIRVHCAESGHPILGDSIHGRPSALAPPRMALHARVLGFVHPETGAELRFESELPEVLASWLRALREPAPPAPPGSDE